MPIKLTVQNCAACGGTHNMRFGRAEEVPEFNGEIELVSECPKTHILVYTWMSKQDYQNQEVTYDQHSSSNM